jgi:NDP-sugar pyrophosphorylase family protein
MNIVVPMAGFGRRFSDAGFSIIKPMIKIGNYRMIDLAVKSCKIDGAKTLFITLNKFITDDIRSVLREHGDLLLLEKPTDGTVSTILECEEYLDINEPLIVVNCDLYINLDIENFLSYCNKYDACFVTFNSDDEKNSYAEMDGNKIKRVAEKEVISNNACAGIYYFKKASILFDNAKIMIEKNIRVNGEFYLTPVFNQIIESGFKTSIYKVNNKDVHLLGTPEQLCDFQNKLILGEVEIV